MLTTHGAIGANHLLYCALVGPGDEVIAVTPNYQQHTAIPEALGADVKRLPLRREAGYRLDLGELRALVTPRTRVIRWAAAAAAAALFGAAQKLHGRGVARAV